MYLTDDITDLKGSELDADSELWLKQFKKQQLANMLTNYFIAFKNLSQFVKQLNIDSRLYSPIRDQNKTHETQHKQSNPSSQPQQQ